MREWSWPVLRLLFHILIILVVIAVGIAIVVLYLPIWAARSLLFEGVGADSSGYPPFRALKKWLGAVGVGAQR